MRRNSRTSIVAVTVALAAPGAIATGARLDVHRSVVEPIPTFRADAGSDPRVVFAAPSLASSQPSTPAATVAGGDDDDDRSDVRPVLECVTTGPQGELVGVFGYDNRSDRSAVVPVGSRNQMHPAPALRGQPTTFLPGRKVGAFRVPFTGTLVWRLGERTSTASGSSRRCAPTPSVLLDRVAVVGLDELAGGPEHWSLKSAGVPTVLATSLADALTSRVVVLAGTLSIGRIGAADRAALEAFVASGGVLIAEAVTDPTLMPLFGIQSYVESAARTRLDWVAGDPTTQDIDRPEERSLVLEDRAQGIAIGTVGYLPLPGATPLATFDDATAAVMRFATPGAGTTYVIGARLLDLVTRHHEGARMPTSRRFENVFATSADVWLLWLRGVHRLHNAGGVTLSSAPDGAAYAVVPTISLNLSAGVSSTESYIRLARAAKARPTVFVWTHTVDDWLESGFFGTPSTRARLVRRYVRLGAEVASHSVSHSPQFGRADVVPLGSGKETAASYRPQVTSRTSTVGASVLGDLRVSRELLESAGAPRVRSYRQGYLLTRSDLAPAQDAVGYAYDSSTTQGVVGGSYPFMPPRRDASGFADVLTFPIVLEDERGAPFHTRIGEGLDLIAANGANGAPSVVLVHPNRSRTKQRAWSTLLRRLPQNVWRGSMAEFGDFWSQRLGGRLVSAASTVCAGGVHVELSSPRADWPLQRQALDVADARLTTLVTPDGRQRTVVAGKVALPTVAGGTTFVGELCPKA